MRQSHCPASLIQRQPRQGHGLRPLPALDRSGVCWIVPLDIDLGAEVKMTSHTDFLTLPKSALHTDDPCSRPYVKTSVSSAPLR